ncbi:TPA: N-6 DNA methylase, partial [Streptococcus suis]|nr:N-6 DNA methylase [Streptococcus suis]
IYQLFIQHIIHSLKEDGQAAIVLPTGFITAQSGIDKKIRQHLVDEKMLAGVVSMPSNIFATTGTNVSILFIDKKNKDDVVLIDASNLGTKVKEGKNQKTVLSPEEEVQIIETFINKEVVEDFSVKVSYEEIKDKNYSLSAGQYFDIKIDYVDISPEEFEEKIQGYQDRLANLFAQSHELEKEIAEQIRNIIMEGKQ